MMCLQSILKEDLGQNQTRALCELPATPGLGMISRNWLSYNLGAAGFLWVPLFSLFVRHQEIWMPKRYSHWKFKHMWAREFRYQRSYPNLILYSKKVFILCGKKVKGQNSNTSEKHLKGQQERQTQHHLEVEKNGSSSRSVIWEEFLPC